MIPNLTTNDKKLQSVMYQNLFVTTINQILCKHNITIDYKNNYSTNKLCQFRYQLGNVVQKDLDKPATRPDTQDVVAIDDIFDEVHNALNENYPELTMTVDRMFDSDTGIQFIDIQFPPENMNM